MGNCIKTVKLLVEIQENGIIRLNSTGRLIGRLSEDEEINFETLYKNFNDIQTIKHVKENEI